ncbi:MAG: hypothetical protein RL151_1699, partial [Bacteroidota bacterium]
TAYTIHILAHTLKVEPGEFYRIDKP